MFDRCMYKCMYKYIYKSVYMYVQKKKEGGDHGGSILMYMQRAMGDN